MNDLVTDIGESFEKKAPRTKEHLAVYCSIVLNIRFPHPASNNEFCVKNGHTSPLDAIWGAYSNLDFSLIWYAMRGSGKTFELSVLSYLESIFKKRCGTTILGGSLEQSTKAVAYLKELWELPKSPKQLLINSEVAGRGYKLRNGSWVEALAASTKSVRGPHPQKLRLDEVDEMTDVIYNAALGQPKSKFGINDNVLISSTLHNPFGLMSKIIDERHKKKAKLYAWCVNEVVYPKGFWTKEEIERRKTQITTAMWEAEYLLLRPKVGDSIFDFESINRSYERGLYDKYNKKLNTEAGIDWGYQVTVLNLIQDYRDNLKVFKSISFENIELTERCYLIADYCIEFNIKKIYADSNPKDSNITLRKILEEKFCDTELITIAFNKWKSVGINVLRYLLEKDLLNITDEICQKKMKEYHYKKGGQGIIAKEDDHYPDSLIAWGASRYKMLEGLKKLDDKKNTIINAY